MIMEEIGIEATCLHSKLGQVQRSSNLKKFRNNRQRVIVCTDVASRGLDIPTVVKFITLSIRYYLINLT